MSPILIIAVIAAYFAVILVTSYSASRGADNRTFFTGNRRMPWPVVAFAMLGAAISGVTFISVPGMVAAKGWSYLQMVLGFVVGYAVIAWVLVPLFYRLNLVSIYGFLDQRFGRPAYRTGAFFFFISKLLGAGVRFFVVCAVLQALVFDPLGVPFWLNVAVTVAMIFVYTARGGVKSLVWTDFIKSFCLIMSVVLSIVFIGAEMDMDLGEMISTVASHPSSRIFYFDNPMEATYFWKQFIAGIFLAIAMNGLDQDMMQRHLSCESSAASRKNMITGSILQVFVIALFLALGVVLWLYAGHVAMPVPDKSDELFGLVATGSGMPAVVGILFVLGLVSASYSAAGSALTALTTSVTVDLLEADRRFDDLRLRRVRTIVHLLMAAAMAVVIIAFYHLGDDDAISAVYTLASYTYGPLLGLFVYGIGMSADSGRQPVARVIPLVCLAAPFGSWAVQWALKSWFGYATGFELLLINAALTVAGLWIASAGRAPRPDPDTAPTV